jgi:molybdopterin-containing oxidoreductase family membrane subunit
MAVYGLFPDPESAQRAVRRLRAAGVSDDDITVISSEPFEDWDFSHRHRATWMHRIAGVGGAVGLMTAYWLTSMTARSWPLPTGGMPIVAPWPNLVIMFELTMLFGILATVGTLLVTAGLPRRRPKLYDPDVAGGKILVGVEGSIVSVEAMKNALSLQSDTPVKTVA